MHKKLIFEQIHLAIKDKKYHRIGKILDSLVEEDIAQLIENVIQEEREIIWEQLSNACKSLVIPRLPASINEKLIELLSVNNEIKEVLNAIAVEDIVDIVQSVNENIQAEILNNLDSDTHADIAELLSYPPNTAGGLMSKNYISVRENVTLGVVLRYLRQLGNIPPSTIGLIVVDRSNYYKGILRLQDILTQDEEVIVSDCLVNEPPPIEAYVYSKDVAHYFEKHDLISSAVVDSKNKLIGRITIDDVVDYIRDEEHTKILATAGLKSEQDIFNPAYSSFKKRLPWLGINLITALMASLVIGIFSETIQQIVALAVLMPIIASMGGIASIQTSTLIIRHLGDGAISSQAAKSFLLKEILVGVYNGLFWALLTGIVAGIWFESWGIGVIFSLALCLNLLVAASVGTLTPLFLEKRGVDPAISSGIIVTTATDVFGFAVFLGMASIVLI